MMTYYLSGGVIAFGGATAEVMKSLLSIENVIEYFL
jgi:hypothetical protein